MEGEREREREREGEREEREVHKVNLMMSLRISECATFNTQTAVNWLTV